MREVQRWCASNNPTNAWVWNENYFFSRLPVQHSLLGTTNQRASTVDQSKGPLILHREIKCSIYMRGRGIDIHDTIVFKGGQHLVRRISKRQFCAR